MQIHGRGSLPELPSDDAVMTESISVFLHDGPLYPEPDEGLSARCHIASTADDVDVEAVAEPIVVFGATP
jgi:hypothetical protein